MKPRPFQKRLGSSSDRRAGGRKPRPRGGWGRPLVLGFFPVGGFRRHEFPSLLFAHIHFGMHFVGVSEHLLDQLLIVVGGQAVTACAMSALASYTHRNHLRHHGCCNGEPPRMGPVGSWVNKGNRKGRGYYASAPRRFLATLHYASPLPMRSQRSANSSVSYCGGSSQ